MAVANESGLLVMEEEEEEEVVVKVEVDQGRRARTTWLSRRNWAMQAE